VTDVIEPLRSVLVTGGAGKVGRYLLATMEEIGVIDCRVFDASAVSERPGFRSFVGDVRNVEAVMSAMTGCSSVIHLAAIPRPGIVLDEVTFQVNVIGTYNVLVAAERLRVERLVYLSSTAVLGTDWPRSTIRPAYLPFDEAHPLQPQDVYGLSKQVGEEMALAFHRATGMTTTVLRPGWVLDDGDVAGLQQSGGLQVDRLHHYSYVHGKDLARACVLALAWPEQGYEVLYVVADDSSAAEPLGQALVPFLIPRDRHLASALDGWRPGITNEFAATSLGWRPDISWRIAGTTL
jgi:nucleoside-diphosphate-sugar epimerase